MMPQPHFHPFRTRHTTIDWHYYRQLQFAVKSDVHTFANFEIYWQDVTKTRNMHFSAQIILLPTYCDLVIRCITSICCFFFKTDCADDEFQCGNGRCIPDSYECDNSDTCGDLSDELNCGKSDSHQLTRNVFYFKFSVVETTLSNK